MKIFTVFLQVVFIHVFLFLAMGLRYIFSIPLPTTIIGLFLLFFALCFGVVKLEWVEKGANWLMAELLLFFIPSAVGIVNYEEIASWQGINAILVIGLGTFIVMGSTAWIVERFKGADPV
ncbi:holin-like protein [Natronobacillus azotifigens]|uniref:CidA/LrgA family protein n=1 Tax=Natronobacillus azotifigens TaxID=472978 RepID=A0A9J6RF56_9BACI|nr:CidA/LrgA family protein [Natronobacillus azotifigens]MCZ0703809.1 CidA/LrgA family protein [Natronobacillus azotifigens]